MKKQFILFIMLLTISSSFAQKNFWTIKQNSDQQNPLTPRKTIPTEFKIYYLDLPAFKAELGKATKREIGIAKSSIVMSFPNADGQLKDFKIYEASVLHPDLQTQFQEIKSYVGIGIDDKTAMIRFSTTLFGVHAMIFSGDREVNYIDTYTQNLEQYIVYSRKDIQASNAFTCLVENQEDKDSKQTQFSPRTRNSINSENGILRTYRLAMACTIEYAQFHWQAAGLTAATPEETRKAAVLAAMVVSMTRVNGLYERDMSITMEFVPNNLDIIFILSDNFNNNNAGTLINQSQTVINSIIGFENYDIGHTVSTGGGGLAQLNSPCSSSKARGITGLFSPVGDPFDIDYVAHEIGHQFGATHTFNNACGGNRTNSTAVEPGSGTTIMAYAGICAPNIQNNSDAHFHAVSIAQMTNFISGGGNCSENQNNNNAAPIIQTIPNYTIPRNTAFVLEGNAIDADDDALTFCWEQTDNGISTQPPTATNAANGPRFRSRNPSINPNRFMPFMNTIFTGVTANTWEVVPSVETTMNFALTVRDNAVVGGGQTARANMTVSTVNDAGPFVVTVPNTTLSWIAGSNQTVTWDVAGTTENGVNTPYVDIFMSIGGLSFPILLASKVPNDGSEIITVPNNVGTTNRIMVKGHENIFLDVSNTNFSITQPVSTMAIAFNGVEGEQNKAVCQGNTTQYNLDYLTFSGFIGTTTFAATGNPAGTTISFVPVVASTAATIQMLITTSTTTPIGLYNLAVTATSGTTVKTVNMYLEVVSGNFGIVSLNSPANEAVVEPSGVSFSWDADPNATLYTIQISTQPTFTTILAQSVVTSTSFSSAILPNSTTLYWRVAPGNSSCFGEFSSVFSFTTTFCAVVASSNIPIIIPASGTSTVNSLLIIPAEENLVIEKVSVSLNISHTWINDLIVTLISPSGTQVQLINRACNPNQGDENAVAIFDDNGIVLICGENPAISGTIIPTQPLAALNGQNAQGEWTLRVQDTFNQDGGSINSWSLTFCGQTPLSLVDETPFLDFALYPNPSRGRFTVQMNQVQSSQIDIAVYDMRGRLLHNQSYEHAGSFAEEIEIQNPQSGIYLVKISDGNRTETKKLIME
jgi:subtilisin-like proprotein convertase family protein